MGRVTPQHLIVAALLMVVALFCVYGFLASFEPVRWSTATKFGYAAIGFGCLATSGWLLFRH